MSVHVDGVFVEGKPYKLNKTKDIIERKFNIQYSGKVRNFFRVYHEWGRDAKGLYENMSMDKDVKKLVEGYKKYIGSDVKVQKTPGTPGTTLSNSDLEETQDIDKYM